MTVLFYTLAAAGLTGVVGSVVYLVSMYVKEFRTESEECS